MVNVDLVLALICTQQPKLLPKFGVFEPANLWGKISPMKLQMVKRFPSSPLPLPPLMSFPLLCVSGFLVQTSKADSIHALRIPSGRWTPFLSNLLRLPPTPHTFPSPTSLVLQSTHDCFFLFLHLEASPHYAFWLNCWPIDLFFFYMKGPIEICDLFPPGSSLNPA